MTGTSRHQDCHVASVAMQDGKTIQAFLAAMPAAIVRAPFDSSGRSSVQHFNSGGIVDIAYIDEGSGPAILLIHGFASTANINWVEPGWVDALVKDGRRVIAFDNRGHGESGKLYDPAAYDLGSMADDARRLLDHLSIDAADVLGYSMGARISARLAISYPSRVRSLILGGLAEALFSGLSDAAEIAEALEAPDIDAVSGDVAFAFRDFAERTGSDLKALAACVRGERGGILSAAVAALPMPVLVAVGSRDSTAGRIDVIPELLPNAELFVIPNRDHMRTVGDRVFREGVLAFLAKRSPVPPAGR